MSCHTKNFISLESEQFVLAALILHNNCWGEIYTFLTIDNFYFNNHKILFSIILEFLNLGFGFDLDTIYNKLKFYKFDFLNYLNYIIQKIPNPSSIHFHASIIHNMFVLRKVLLTIFNLGQGIDVKDLNINNVLNNIERNILDVNNSYIKERNDLNAFNYILDNYFNNYSFLNKKIYNSGFFELDNLIKGFQGGDFIIVAGRPSMGKTTFSLNIAKNISEKYDHPVLIFSMEMSTNQIFIKILSSILDENQDLVSNSLNNGEYKKNKNFLEKVNSMKLFIDESVNLTTLQIYSKCKLLIKKYGSIALVVVDYLQLMNSSLNYNQNRVFEISEISRSLKCLAKELDTTILAVSQLNRNLESRNNKKPLISDLRESGSIEQDADIVLFIYREEVYNSLSVNKNIAEVIIGKHRNGSLGSFNLNFFDKKSKFSDIIF